MTKCPGVWPRHGHALPLPVKSCPRARAPVVSVPARSLCGPAARPGLARAPPPTLHAGPQGPSSVVRRARSVYRVHCGIGGHCGSPLMPEESSLSGGGGGGVSLPGGPAPSRPRCCRPGGLNHRSLSSQIRSLRVQGQGVGRVGCSVVAWEKLTRASLPGSLVVVLPLGTAVSVCKRPLFIRTPAMLDGSPH